MTKEYPQTLHDPNLLVSCERTYPQGYFAAQLAFARRITQIGDYQKQPINLAEALFTYTALHRRLFGKPKDSQPSADWQSFSSQIDPHLPDSDLIPLIWQTYTSNQNSLYQPPQPQTDGRHFGAFIWKYNSKKFNLELHFEDQDRSLPSNFSRSEIPRRVDDINRLMAAVNQKLTANPDFSPNTVTLGSWMNNLPGVQSSLPEDFVASAVILRPPSLNFGGDSLWGQMINRLGAVHSQRYSQFLDSISQAQTWDQLLESFPLPVLFFKTKFNQFNSNFPLSS